jgi:hypothetical protein
MVRIKQLMRYVPFMGAALFLGGCTDHPTGGPSTSAAEGPAAQKTGAGDVPATKKTAEALAREWSFNPANKKKLQSWGNETVKSGENLVVASGRLQDQGKANEWLALFAKFYAEKCGSEQELLKSDNGKVTRALGLNGVSKTKGRYLITEPALMSIPVNQIPARPNTLLFAHQDAEATITVMLWQQGEDVLFMAMTVAVR